MKKALLGLLFFILPVSLLAQLNKGYGQIEKSQFAEAKISLFKNRAGSKPGSNNLTEAFFGLFNYYNADGNPDVNYDSAWLYLDSTSTNFKEEFKAKYKPFEKQKISKVQIDTLKVQVEANAFNKAAAANTVVAWKQYIGFYTKSNNAPLLARAQKGLQQKVYDDCAKNNDVDCLEGFVKEYANATQVDSAKMLIEKLKWKNTLTANTRDGYAAFIKTYPTTSHLAEATDSLSAIDYRIVARATITGAFKAYLATYPNSKFKAAAETHICQLAYDSVAAVNKEKVYNDYIASYPGCPQVSIVSEKLARLDCERCLAAPTKDCLVLVMKTCGTDNTIAQRVNTALIALMDQDKSKIECERCLANPNKACLLQVFRNCAADSGIIKRANDVFLAVIDKERNKFLSDSLARMKAATAAATPAASVPPVETADKAGTVEMLKVDTTRKAKPDVDNDDNDPVAIDDLLPMDKQRD